MDKKICIAARALCGWKQRDLADKSGISLPAIQDFEQGNKVPRTGTVAAIKEAFETAGIEFIDDGLRTRKHFIRIIEGDDSYLRLLDEIHRDLESSKGEMLLSGADERRSTVAVTEKTQLMRKSGIQFRFLIKNGNTHIMGPLSEYRWVPEKLFVDGDVKIIFGNKTAYYISWHGQPKVIIIEEKNITDENRRMFDFIWDNSKQPKTTTAKEFY